MVAGILLTVDARVLRDMVEQKFALPALPDSNCREYSAATQSGACRIAPCIATTASRTLSASAFRSPSALMGSPKRTVA